MILCWPSRVSSGVRCYRCYRCYNSFSKFFSGGILSLFKIFSGTKIGFSIKSLQNFFPAIMAIKYSKRKKHNSGTIRKSYNNKTGRTRVTTTVKQKHYTRSRSVNQDGSVRITKTHRSPSGFITRTVKTFGKRKSSASPKISSTVTKKPKKISYSRPSKSKTVNHKSNSSGSWFWLVAVVILLYWLFT